MNKLGLQGKLMVGIFVPILVAFLIIGGMLFVSVGPFVSIRALGSNSLKELGSASVRESAASLNKLGEQIIQGKAESVAKQIEIYLESHPGLSGASLANDPRLQEIAVQRVGETGYTAVHNNKGVNYFHVNPKIVGTDLHGLADKLPDFVKVMDAGLHAGSGRLLRLEGRRREGAPEVYVQRSRGRARTLSWPPRPISTNSVNRRARSWARWARCRMYMRRGTETGSCFSSSSSLSTLACCSASSTSIRLR